MAITVKLGSGSVLSANLGGGSVITANIGGGSTLTADMGEGATTPPGPGYCPEYQLVYDSWTNKPDSTQAGYQNTWVETCVNNSYWATQWDFVYMTAIHTNTDGEAQKEWISGGVSYTLTNVNACVFTPYEGFKGDGISSYLDTGWSYVDARVLTDDWDNCGGGYCRTNVNGLYTFMGGKGSTAYTWLLRPRISGNFQIQNFQGTVDIGAVGDSLGMLVNMRDAQLNDDGYKNSVKVVDGATAGASPVINSASIGLLINNDNGTPKNFFPGQGSLWFMGKALTPAGIITWTNAFEAYMDSNGKGVIS